MTVVYLDSSAAAKLILAEPESDALATWLEREQVALQATPLLETELRRLAVRDDLPQEDVSALLETVEIHEIPHSLFREAGLLPGRDLRSLDALHLAAAIRLGVDVLVTYDRRLGAAAVTCGLRTLAPA